MRPASGRVRPATQRRTVVLPEPEAPNRIVTPAGGDERDVERELRRQPLRGSSTATRHAIGAAAQRPPAEAVDGQQHEQREHQQHERGLVGRADTAAPARGRRSAIETVRVTPGRLPPTISTTPNSPTVCAKLRTTPAITPSIDSGSVTRRNVRSRDAPSVAEASRSERVDLGERGGDRLHGERQAVEHRRDDQPFERERQRRARSSVAPPVGRAGCASPSPSADRSRARSAAGRAAARRPTSTRNVQRRRENASQCASGRLMTRRIAETIAASLAVSQMACQSMRDGDDCTRPRVSAPVRRREAEASRAIARALGLLQIREELAGPARPCCDALDDDGRLIDRRMRRRRDLGVACRWRASAGPSASEARGCRRRRCPNRRAAPSARCSRPAPACAAPRRRACSLRSAATAARP